MRKRSFYQVITEAKSAPVGIDWLMIRAASGVVRPQRDSWERIQRDSDAEKSAEHLLDRYYATTAAS